MLYRLERIMFVEIKSLINSCFPSGLSTCYNADSFIHGTLDHQETSRGLTNAPGDLKSFALTCEPESVYFIITVRI
jgi:hypothetical protein